MFISVNEIHEYADTIQRILDRITWVSNYELFVQSYTTKNIQFTNGTLSKSLVDQVGFSLRILSKNKRIVEKTYSTSTLSSLLDLKEPNFIREPVKLSEFPPLKQPRRYTTISMSGVKSIDIAAMDRHIEFCMENSFEGGHHTSSFEIQREYRLITDSSSVVLEDSKLHTICQGTYSIFNDNQILKVHDRCHSIKINPDREKILRNLQQKMLLFKYPVDKHSKFSANGVLLHPKILGELLTQFTRTFLLNSRLNENWYWDPKLSIIDDPLMKDGYFSSMFDDEGSLTKTKILVDGGKIENSLEDKQSTGFKGGGSGYRSGYYQALRRSYSYPLDITYTNLLLQGGIGKGSEFTQRSGNIITVEDGEIFLSGGRRNPQFIIYCRNAFLYHDGSIQSQIPHLSISGSFNDLMKRGVFSKDKLLYVNDAIPGNIYCGYVYIDSNLVKIS